LTVGGEGKTRTISKHKPFGPTTTMIMTGGDNHNSNSTFILEDFAVCLAANLLGATKIEQRLASSANFPLVWRSPPLTPLDPSWLEFESSSAAASRTAAAAATTSDDSQESSNDTFDLVFVDISFSFVTRLPPSHQEETCSNDDTNDAASEKDYKRISMAFGAMVRQQNRDSGSSKNNSDDNFFYIQGPAVSREFLEHHMDQHGTLIEGTKARVIAKLMALALLDTLQLDKQKFGTIQVAMANNGQEVEKVDITLQYSDGNDNDDDDDDELASTLTIANAGGRPAVKSPPETAKMLLRSILADQNPENEKTTTKPKKFLGSKECNELLEKVQVWKAQAMEWMLERERAERELRNAATMQQSSFSGTTTSNKSVYKNPYKQSNSKSSNNPKKDGRPGLSTIDNTSTTSSIKRQRVQEPAYKKGTPGIQMIRSNKKSNINKKRPTKGPSNPYAKTK
jgi:hypothetical protein